MALSDGQFSIDGYVFGGPGDEAVVLTDGWDKGEHDVRSQDVPSPIGDSMLFGRDRLTPGVWRFTIACRKDGDVNAVVRRLAAAWRGDKVRATPGARQTLELRQNGTTWRVYGRGRRFVVEPDEVTDRDFRVVNCDFQLADTLIYSGTENYIDLDLITTGSAEAGLVLPAVLPWETVQSSTVRRGIVTITTDVETPFIATFKGPVAGQATGYTLYSTGWKVALNVTLGPGDVITLDTSTGRLSKNGAPFGLSAPGSRLRARLQPGGQELVFTANDPTASATATVRWRDVAITV